MEELYRQGNKGKSGKTGRRDQIFDLGILSFVPPLIVSGFAANCRIILCENRFISQKNATVLQEFDDVTKSLRGGLDADDGHRQRRG